MINIFKNQKPFAKNDQKALAKNENFSKFKICNFLGPVALIGWVGAAVVGFLLLETVNYVEHYGMQRELLPNGRYERVSRRHSWTSDHPVSRALLFELPRHADHHAHAGRPYGSLRHFSDAPQLPTGYAGMVLLALVPPLYFRVMDEAIDRETVRLAA